jgi:hypothetical protein
VPEARQEQTATHNLIAAKLRHLVCRIVLFSQVPPRNQQFCNQLWNPAIIHNVLKMYFRKRNLAIYGKVRANMKDESVSIF